MTMHTKILEWFFLGDVGNSSKTMAFIASGIKVPSHKKVDADDDSFDDFYYSHPYDPSDLNRCFKLVDAIPEITEHFDTISKVSPEWKLVIQHWQELKILFESEVGKGWEDKTKSAKLTYNRMKEIFKTV